MKKVVVWLMVAMMAVSVCGCGFSDGVKDGMGRQPTKKQRQRDQLRSRPKQRRPKLRNLRAFRKQKLNQRRKHRL